VPAKNLDSVLFSDRERRGVRATKGTDFCTRDRQAERVQRRLIECPTSGMLDDWTCARRHMLVAAQLQPAELIG